MDGRDTGGQKGGKEKKRVAGRAMESRFSFSSPYNDLQPYRRESPYTVAEEGRIRREEIEEKRTKHRGRWCSRCSGEQGEEERRGDEGGRGKKGRAIEEGG